MGSDGEMSPKGQSLSKEAGGEGGECREDEEHSLCPALTHKEKIHGPSLGARLKPPASVSLQLAAQSRADGQSARVTAHPPLASHSIGEPWEQF